MMKLLDIKSLLITFLLFFSCMIIAVKANEQHQANTPIDLDSIKAPPRDIKDILKVLENSKIDLTEINRAKEVVKFPPPPDGSSIEVFNQFYRRQAIAFEKLGQLNSAVESMKKAAFDYPSTNSTFYIGDLGDYGNYQNFAGRPYINLDMLREKNKIMVSDWKKYGGWYFSNSRQLIAMLAYSGNFIEAQEILRDLESALVVSRSWKGYSIYGTNWESQLESARAILLWRQGMWVESERAYRKALILLRRVYEGVKNNGKKLDELADGARQVQDSTNTVRWGASQLIHREIELADSLLRQRKLIEAEFYAREALQITLDTFDKSTPLVSRCLEVLSEIISEQGRPSEAALLANEAVKSLIDGGISDDSLRLFFSRKAYGKALANQGEYASADKVFNEMEVGLTKDPRNKDSLGKKNSFEWVITLLKVGKLQEAQDMAEVIAKNAENLYGNNINKTALSQTFKAYALAANNNADAANMIYKKTIPIIINQIRGDLENDTNSIKYQNQIKFLLEGYLDVLAHQIEDKTNLPDVASEAFQIADIARGSSVQRALTASAARANIKDPQLAALARKEQDIQRRTLTLSDLLTSLRSAPTSQQLPSIQNNIQVDLEMLKLERDSLKKEIERKFPDYANLVEPKPASIEAVKKVLKEDEVLLSWYFTDKSAYLWGITKDGPPAFIKLSISRNEMAKEVSDLRKSLDPNAAYIETIPAFDVALAHKLYSQILAPVESLLVGKRLMISVPHNELAQLPLSVLVTKPTPQPEKTPIHFLGYRNVPWLAKDIAITQIPSVTALVSLRSLPLANPTRKNFVGFGDPFFSITQQKEASTSNINQQLVSRSLPVRLRNTPKTRGVSSAELALLPRLADTADELIEVGKVMGATLDDIFLQDQASVKKVMSMDLSNRKVVMFSTHGLVPGELNGLTQPALALSSPDVTGDKDDGLLTMDRVISLKLDADWVVLSACNTAAGDGAGSESISGLGKAFFFAGARALLVSNWPVDSDAARVLMTDLFKIQNQTSTSNADISKAQSLKQSMMNMLNNSGLKVNNVMKYSYAHPLFWAPFVMVGD